MPLLLLSGILLPMALAPAWLQTLSSLNPFTHTVDAARALFNGQWGDPEIAIGVADHGGHGRHLRVGRGPHVQPRQRVASRGASAECLARLARLVGPQPEGGPGLVDRDQRQPHQVWPSIGSQPLSRVRSVWIFEEPFG